MGAGRYSCAGLCWHNLYRESSSDSRYIRAEDFHGLTSNANWNGNRVKVQFLNVLVDTIAAYGNVPTPEADSLFFRPVTRYSSKRKKSKNMPSPSSVATMVSGVCKFTAAMQMAQTGKLQLCAHADFPVFRLADALHDEGRGSLQAGWCCQH